MELSTIEYEKKGAVAYVTLNRPDKLNAMSVQMHDELAWAWADWSSPTELAHP